MSKFEVGKTYTSRCFGDHTLVENWTVTKRTEKTITATEKYEGTRTFRIKTTNDGTEFVRNCAGFSNISADRIAE